MVLSSVKGTQPMSNRRISLEETVRFKKCRRPACPRISCDGLRSHTAAETAKAGIRFDMATKPPGRVSDFAGQAGRTERPDGMPLHGLLDPSNRSLLNLPPHGGAERATPWLL
jgi:hypothetical protein